MNCPACNYMMSDFDETCPRCKGKGLAQLATTQSTDRRPTQTTSIPLRRDAADSTTEVLPWHIRIMGLLLLIIGVALTYGCWDGARKTGHFFPMMALAGPLLTVVGFGCAIFATPFPQKGKGEEMEPITRVFLVIGTVAGILNYVVMKGGL